MPNTTTLNENHRASIDGTEQVRLATSGANWRATLAEIIAALAVPGSPAFAIQFNNSGFDGDADFLWTPGVGNANALFAAVGNTATLNPTPSAGGTHYCLLVDVTYDDTQLEGSIFDFAVGSTAFVSGHKTSGAMGQMSGLLISTDLTLDAGTTARALQAAHFTAHAQGDGDLTTGLQALQIEATVDLTSTGGIGTGYLSAAEVYANLNTADDCSAVYGLVSQAYTGAASATVTDFYASYINTYVDTNGVVTTARALELFALIGGTVDQNYILHIPATTGGGTINDHYAVAIEDQSGVASGDSWNLWSKGASSINVFEGSVITTGLAVGSLPAASAALAGARRFVTDANATTFASVVAGSGSNKVPVYCDGTNWRIG